LGFELVESKVGTAETEMDEGKPAVVTPRDSETDLKQRAEPDVMDLHIDSKADEGDRLGFELVESKVGTAETEMDEGKPAVVTARDSETDSKQRAEP
jgi:hypothetical protein